MNMDEFGFWVEQREQLEGTLNGVAATVADALDKMTFRLANMEGKLNGIEESLDHIASILNHNNY